MLSRLGCGVERILNGTDAGLCWYRGHRGLHSCLCRPDRAAALMHAQSFHVCHLDAVLENFRVATDGRVVLANWGNCKRFKKRTMIVPYVEVGGVVH